MIKKLPVNLLLIAFATLNTPVLNHPDDVTTHVKMIKEIQQEGSEDLTRIYKEGIERLTEMHEKEIKDLKKMYGKQLEKCGECTQEKADRKANEVVFQLKYKWLRTYFISLRMRCFIEDFERDILRCFPAEFSKLLLPETWDRVITDLPDKLAALKEDLSKPMQFAGNLTEFQKQHLKAQREKEEMLVRARQEESEFIRRKAVKHKVNDTSFGDTVACIHDDLTKLTALQFAATGEYSLPLPEWRNKEYKIIYGILELVTVQELQNRCLIVFPKNVTVKDLLSKHWIY